MTDMIFDVEKINITENSGTPIGKIGTSKTQDTGKTEKRKNRVGNKEG